MTHPDLYCPIGEVFDYSGACDYCRAKRSDRMRDMKRINWQESATVYIPCVYHRPECGASISEWVEIVVHQGITVEEVSYVMGLSVSTVRRQLQNARR